MSISRLTRRGASLIALAGYLLAATVSGMFHDHGGLSCGASGLCATHGTRDLRHPAEGDAHGHHGPSHGGHRHQPHGADEPSRSAPERQGHEPLHDDDCAACRFLAQHSIVVPRVVPERLERTIALVSDLAPACVGAVVADAHPARGPPSA